MPVDYMVALRSFDSGGVQYVNTLCIRGDGASASPDPTAQEVGDGVYDWLHVDYTACLSTGYTWDDIVTREIGAPTVNLHTVGLTGTCSTSTPPCPKECVVTVSLQTAHATRRGRGHISIPSPRDAGRFLDSTSWKTSSSSYWGAILQLCDDLENGHDITYGPAGIYTGHLSTRVYSRLDATSYDVINAVPRSQIRWLRSRSTAP